MCPKSYCYFFKRPYCLQLENTLIIHVCSPLDFGILCLAIVYIYFFSVFFKVLLYPVTCFILQTHYRVWQILVSIYNWTNSFRRMRQFDQVPTGEW